MQGPRFSDKIDRLKLRLAWFFAAAVLLIAAGGAAYHAHYRGAIRQDAADLLSSVLRSKTDQILFWRADRVNDTTSLLDTPVLSVFLNRLAASPEDKELRAYMLERLQRYLKHNRYKAASLVKPDGAILVAAGEVGAKLPPETLQLIKKAAASGRTELGDFYLDSRGSPRIDIAARAAEGNGKKLYLVLEISPEDYLYPLIRQWPTNSATAETTLSRREGDLVVSLAPLRHSKDAPLKVTRPLADKTLPAARAIRGEAGVFLSTDYRGEKVLAAVGMVPGSDWALVVKMDWAEVSAKAGRFSLLLLLLALALALAAGATTYLVFHLQSAAYESDLREVESEKERYKFSYETLSDKANDMILLSDPEKRALLMVNHKTCETYGYTEEEMLRLHPEDLIAPENLIAFNARFKALAEGAGMTYETVHIKKNGERFPIEVSATGIRQDGRDLVYFICRDITERKRLEGELKEKERRLAGILHNLPGMAYRCGNDPQWTLQFVSNGCEQLTGYKPAELIGNNSVPYSDLILPEDRDRVWREVQAAVSAGRPYRFIYRIRRKDGTLRTVWEQGSAIKGPQGAPEALEGLIIDDSDKAAAEEALLESEKRYRFLFEHNPMPMLIYERASLRMLAVNEVFLKHYGYGREQALALKLTDLYPENEKARIVEVASGLRGLANVGEWHHRRSDGSFIDIIAQSHDIDYKGSRARVAVMTDITRMKRDELRMTELNAELSKNLRLYTVLAQINRAAADIRDRETLYGKLCETAVTAGGFRMAWIGQPDKDTGRVLPVCSDGEGAEEYLDSIKISLKDGPTSKGPTSTAARTGRISVSKDIEVMPEMAPWKEKALRLGYRSSAAIPLFDGDKLASVLSIYSGEKDFFTQEEVGLLEEIKADVSLALEAISAEKRRAEAQAALERTAAHLSHAMEAVPMVLMRARRQDGKLIPIWISGNTRELTGHDPAEMLDPKWFSSVLHPEDKARVMGEIAGLPSRGTLRHSFRLKTTGGKYIEVLGTLANSETAGELNGAMISADAFRRAGPGGVPL